jgi:hypothetical protein
MVFCIACRRGRNDGTSEIEVDVDKVELHDRACIRNPQEEEEEEEEEEESLGTSEK